MPASNESPSSRSARSNGAACPAPAAPAGRSAHGAVRGRGAGVDPPNRFETLHLEVLDERLEALHLEHPDGVQIPTQLYVDRTKRLINRVDSPDLPFHWTINPYRGCEHGCVYCYARPTHETLGWNCGLDFESRILVKTDAPELLRRELAAPSWGGEPIAMSGVTDAYQPVEQRLRITRRCLEIMAAARQPVSIVTKSQLVMRDVDLLADLAAHGAATVAVSLTTLDPALSGGMEPRASRPAARLDAMRALAAAGVPVMAMIAPVIPGLNDREIPRLLAAAADAGATSAAFVMLRLPLQVRAVMLDWLRRRLPDRAQHIETLIRQVRDGDLNDSTFGRRMTGDGPVAAHIRRTFTVFRRRAGLDRPIAPLSSAHFRRPALDGQLPLFDA